MSGLERSTAEARAALFSAARVDVERRVQAVAQARVDAGLPVAGTVHKTLAERLTPAQLAECERLRNQRHRAWSVSGLAKRYDVPVEWVERHFGVTIADPIRAALDREIAMRARLPKANEGRSA